MMPGRILLVEDDAVLAAELQVLLGRAGYQVTWAADGQDGLERALASDFDAIVLDRMLPRLDGLAVLQRLRDKGRRSPVLFLTALSAVDERVRGLQAGGDDYLVKPFDPAELLARLETIQRRQAEASETMLRLGPLKLDLLARRAFRDGRDLGLLPHEFRLLEYMVRRPNKVLTREMILLDVWNYRFVPESNVVAMHVSKLRRKMEGNGEAMLIHTVRGVGFVLRVET
jgi:two-component system OmpR family response regulator